MKHMSKIDGKTYGISYSATMEHGVQVYDDVMLIWSYEFPDLIGYYYGEYDYDTTENYIQDYLDKHKEGVGMDKRVHEISEELNDYMASKNIGGDITPMQSIKWDALCIEMSKLITEIEEQNKSKSKKMDISICYIQLIQDCLETIKKHNLIELVYGSYADKDDRIADCEHLQIVLDDFCKPLTNADNLDDIVITVYE